MIQLIGWAVFEIVVITEAGQQLLPWHGVRWPYIVAAGLLTTVMAIRRGSTLVDAAWYSYWVSGEPAG